MVMDRNREAFRNRFQAYKNGKSVKEIYGIPEYQNGKVNWSRWDNAQTTPYTIPFIEDKAVTLTDAGRATGARLSTNLLDSLADNAMRAGVPVRTAIGLATKESTLGNPTDDKTAWNISSAIREQFNGVYPGTVQHINNGTNIVGNSLINYYKGNLHPGGMKKSTLQQGLEFYKQHPDKYNPGQPGYQKAVEARGNEVMKSPEVQKWYKKWEKDQMQIMRPKPYSFPTIQDTAPKKFGKYADGKLPGYQDGNEPEPVQAAKSAIDFANLYYNSPGFNERFRNVTSDKIGFLNSQYNPTASYWEDDGWENHPKMSWNVRRTPLKIGKIHPIPEPNAKYDPYSGNILWGDSSTPQVTGMNWNTIMAHELGHALDYAIKVNNSWLGPRLHENAGERGYTYSNLFPILRKSKPYQQIRNTMDAKEARDYDKYPTMYTGGFDLNSHDARPEENYADLFSMRKILYDLGIFDSTKSGQKFTKQHLDAFKKKSKNRLLDNFSDEDVIWMINNIAGIGNNKKLSQRQKEV